MTIPLVSVIVVNWNGQAYLDECFKALKTQTFTDFEIILVDNGSTDGSLDLVEERYHDLVTIIRNPANLGFAKGNNVGILASKGKYVATLNNDTWVDPRWLEELVRAAENDEDIGMCASKICLARDPKTIDSAGVCIYPDGTSKQRAWMEPDEGRCEIEEEVLLPPGETEGLELPLYSGRQGLSSLFRHGRPTFPHESIPGREKPNLGCRQELPCSILDCSAHLHLDPIRRSGLRRTGPFGHGVGVRAETLMVPGAWRPGKSLRRGCKETGDLPPQKKTGPIHKESHGSGSLQLVQTLCFRLKDTGTEGLGRPMERILVIIPAFNEEKNIVPVIEEIRSTLASCDIIVIDDGSSDGTARMVKGSKEALIRHPINLGYGVAVQTGLKYAREQDYDMAILLDGDGQHDPADIDVLTRSLKENPADVVIGSRFLHNKKYRESFARKAGRLLFAGISRVITGQRILDITSGFQALNKKAIHFLADEYPKDFPDAEVTILLSLHGFKMIEVPVDIRARQHGRSMYTVLRSAYYPLKVLIAILAALLRNAVGRIGGDSCQYKGKST
ncbi:MAG: glycosyltransferase [Armatimonadetes bacterium]|nr:glycosyltransferase [Armatimonadota bacterium]